MRGSAQPLTIGYVVPVPVVVGVGAAVGAVVGLLTAIEEAVGGSSEEKLSDEDKRKIRAAKKRLLAAFSNENARENLQNQILKLSRKQQSPDLFTTSSAPYQLQIEVQEIGLFRTPENPRNGRLWAAVEASLTDKQNKSELANQRICYGSFEAISIVALGEPDSERLREGLTTAYRYIANRIQTEMVGLAPVPDSPRTWGKTALACVKPAQRQSSVTRGER